MTATVQNILTHKFTKKILQHTLTTPAQCFSSFQWYNKKRKDSTKADHSRSNDRICPDFNAFSGRPRPKPSFHCIHQLRRSRFLLHMGPSVISGGRPMWPGTHSRLGPMNLGCSTLQTAGEDDHTHQQQKWPSISHDHSRPLTALYLYRTIALIQFLHNIQLQYTPHPYCLLHNTAESYP